MASAPATVADDPVPLCVDLDGTLLKTDLLWESMLRLLRRNPLWLVALPAWWLRGRAHLKRQIGARSGPLDAARLPVNPAFLAHLRTAHEQGRPLILATASDAALAQPVADHFGLFREVLASDGQTNLRGETKRQKLAEKFGERGFDYAGNSSVDLAVWRGARAAIVVNAPPGLARQAAQVTRLAASFDEAGGRLGPLVAAAQPLGWIPNLLALAPLLLTAWWLKLAWLGQALLGFVALNFAASAVRLGNQLFDLDSLRQSAAKRLPPLASGALPLSAGLALLPALLALAYLAAAPLGGAFATVLTMFLLLETAYLRRYWRLQSVGPLVLATLAALRLVAGALAVTLGYAGWLILATPVFFVAFVLLKWPQVPAPAASVPAPGTPSTSPASASPTVTVGSAAPERSDLVLVTGALGWLGSRLVEALLNGLPGNPTPGTPRRDLQIRCLVLPGQDFLPLAKRSDRIRIVVGDLRLPGDCARFCAGARGAVLLHAAGVVHPDRVAAFNRVNRDGTRRLLDAAVANRLRRAVVVSSAAVADWAVDDDEVLDEQTPVNPRRAEGHATLDLELAVSQRSDRLETVILRAPRFYGPGMPPTEARVFQQLRAGTAPIVGAGQQLRSRVFIDNVCQAMLLAAKVERAAGQVYWIADERAYSTTEFLDAAERLLEAEFAQACPPRRRRWPEFAGLAADFAGRAIELGGWHCATGQRLAELNRRCVCSIAKAQAELGYQPQVDLEEGLRRTLRWLTEKESKA